MTTTIKNRVYAVGTSSSTIVPTGSATTTILGLNLCNANTTDITVDCWITDGGTDYYLFKNLEIPMNSTAQPLSDVQRVHVNNTQTLKIQANTGSNLHVTISVGETV